MTNLEIFQACAIIGSSAGVVYHSWKMFTSPITITDKHTGNVFVMDKRNQSKEERRRFTNWLVEQDKLTTSRNEIQS